MNLATWTVLLGQSWATLLRLSMRALFTPRRWAGGDARRFLTLCLFLPALACLQAINWFGLLLDELFFRAYRRVPVREPVFIVGVPRSGTTLLHRVLARDAERFTSFRLWELAFAPSVTQRVIWLGIGRFDRWLGRPGGRLIDWLERRACGDLDNVHLTSWQSPEEDYLLLTPIHACFLMILPFPFADEIWRLARFDRDVPPAQRRRVMAFYRACVQRHLYVYGPEKQFLSKNVSFSPMVESLREAFPDARIIANVRDPLEAVPSLLSSMQEGARLFGFRPEAVEFNRRLMELAAFYYHHLAKAPDRDHGGNYMIVEYRALTRDLESAVRTIYARCGMEPTDAFLDSLRRAAERARQYRPSHRYHPEQFGLTPEMIRHYYADAYTLYDFDSPSVVDPDISNRALA